MGGGGRGEGAGGRKEMGINREGFTKKISRKLDEWIDNHHHYFFEIFFYVFTKKWDWKGGEENGRWRIVQIQVWKRSTRTTRASVV